MEGRIVLEVCCSANYGRSEPARLILGNELKNDPLFHVISSGTFVDDIVNNRVSLDKKIAIMTKVLERTTDIKPDLVKGVEYLVKKEVKDLTQQERVKANKLYDLISNQFHEEETTYRTEALKYFMIPGFLKEKQEQTIARPDVMKIFPMAESNAAKVKSIYDDAITREETNINKPNIVCLDVPDTYGGTKDQYFAGIQVLMNKLAKEAEKIRK